MKRDRSILLAFLAASLVLRLPGHLDSGIWFDEIWLLTESVRVPFRSLFTTFESDNNHPLYTVLAWLSVHAFGERVWALRLPALVFGVASIGMMWRFARLVTTREEAALATALLTVSYHHVWFSQNARGYTMLLFWTLAATYFLERIFEGAGRRAWVAYGLCMALATYTHASAVLVAVAHLFVAVIVMAARRGAIRSLEDRWAPILGLGLAALVSLTLHAAMLPDMIAAFTADSSTGTQVAAGPSEWRSPLWMVSAAVQSLGVPAILGWTGLAVGGLLAAIGIVVVGRRSWRHALLYVMPVLTTLAATLALGRNLRPRFFFHLGGFGALVLVAGVFAGCEHVAARSGKWQVRLKVLSTSALILASLAILPKAYTLPKQDFEGALAYALTVRSDHEPVVTTGLTVLPYRDYYGQGFPEVSSSAELDSLLAVNDAVYVLHTLPIYLESTAPELAARLLDSLEVARFRGSLGDGDVVVYRLPGTR